MAQKTGIRWDPLTFHTIAYYLLYSSINYYYCFGNKIRFSCNALWRYQRLNVILFNFRFFLFQTKKLFTSCLKRWKEKHKNIELISRFKYALKHSLLKKFHGCFLNNIKTARLAAPLIVLGKWEVSSGLQIYPYKILRRTNKACKALE